MLLKKQTVWLLTMLSLVVVLSVYYITSPEQKSSDLAAVEEKAKEDQEQAKTDPEAKNDDETIVSQAAGDEEFEELRLKLDVLRSEMKEELNTVAASTNLPAEERSEAYDQMQKLNQTAQKEEMLETLIRTLGYEDALVSADGAKVRITVKSNKEHSRTAANDIIKMVKKEIGETNYVAVTFQPAK